MKFEEVLNDYIDILDCSSKELSNTSGLSASAISRYRNGDRVPSYKSKEFNRLLSGIVQIAKNKNIPEISITSVKEKFTKSYGKNAIDFNILKDNLNIIIARSWYQHIKNGFLFRF